MSNYEKSYQINQFLVPSTDSEWIMYLRKSRQDDPNETVEEVLAKHEVQLQDYAERELGGRISPENIYREVVSGESIEDREAVQKVLARIENPSVRGVLVIEPQRLSRGDLEDCGRLINDFRYTKTLVVTPQMTYDLENKMERKFFQDELLRGRDFLEYTKEILFRGRVASVKRGCYIGTRPPYGYDKIKIGKDHTLTPNENADVVRMIFEWYTKDNMTPFRIAQRLNEMGIKAPLGEKWVKDTIRVIVRNRHYIGKVVFNKIKTTTVVENGERITKKLSQPEEDVIVAEGKHPAIIDLDTWNAAQSIIEQNPRVKYTYPLKNPFSTMLKCSACGKAMFIHPYKKAEDRYECKNKPRCFKSVKYSEMESAIITALEQSELPALEKKAKGDDGNALKIQKRLLEKLEKQMQEYREQEEHQFELLETRVYSQDLFERRNAVLREKMEDCQRQIYKANESMPASVNYEEMVTNMKKAIEALKDPEATPEEKNRLLKAIVRKIIFTGSTPVDKTKWYKKGDNQFSLKIFLRL